MQAGVRGNFSAIHVTNLCAGELEEISTYVSRPVSHRLKLDQVLNTVLKVIF